MSLLSSRRLRVSLAVALSMLAVTCGRNAPPPQRSRPNVVFILTDDQRWDAISLQNPDGPLQTPNIDRIGREGVHFRNAFATTSLCSPSRATILSGKYAHAHGVKDNFTELPADTPTWPRALQAAGYETAYIGKYHMGEDNDEPRPGFSYFATHRGQGQYFDTEFRINGGERKVIPGYYTHVVSNLAEEWIRGRSTDKPWAIVVGHKAPHSFYFPEPKYEHAFDEVQVPYPPSAFMLEDKPTWYQERLSTWHGIYGPLFGYRKEFPDRTPQAVGDFERMVRSYWATIRSIDDSVGRIYALLAERGQLDNTIFVFTSDHGILNGEHGMIDKRTAHEESIRIPLVVRYPGLTPTTSPKAVSRMVLTTDFAPSILELCGVAVPAGLHGRSWAGLTSATPPADWRTNYVYMYNYERQFPYTPNVRAIRTEQWKYVRYPNADTSHKSELYNLVDDPLELVNLIDDPHHRSRVADLHAQLDRQLRTLGAWPDVMPRDEGIGQQLPDAKIR